jgi:adenylate cyclase
VRCVANEAHHRCRPGRPATPRPRSSPRIGVSSGPAIAGVIGSHKFAYDLWGDTVSTAARMGAHGIRGEIQVSRSAHDRLLRSYRTAERGVIEVKGKAPTRTWPLNGRRDLSPIAE